MGNNINIQLDDFVSGQARGHMYRYYFARGFIEPGDTVVDAACGYGYGTELFSRVAKKVIGIDRDENVIKYATEHYKRDNNYFMVGNLDQMESLPVCDVWACVETFEHLRFPESFASKLMQSVKRTIIITCPIVPTTHEDPTHLHDFTESQAKEIFNHNGWITIDSSLQGIYMLAAFHKNG